MFFNSTITYDPCVRVCSSIAIDIFASDRKFMAAVTHVVHLPAPGRSIAAPSEVIVVKRALKGHILWGTPLKLRSRRTALRASCEYKFWSFIIYG